MQRRTWRRLIGASLAAQGLLGLSGFLWAHEPHPYTEEWWAERASDPPGTRQEYKHGKFWPPFSRPTGREQHWVHKYHDNHYWPLPYVCEDRAYVQNLMAMQASAGWVGATTLREYHFDPETHDLNSAGRQHLYWILTQAPAQSRTVYIAQGMSLPAAQVRLANTERAARELAPETSVPFVLRHDQFLGRPAQEIDQLQRLDLQSIPRPRLFVIGSGNRSGGSAGASSGGSSSGSSSSGGSSSR